MRNLSVSASLVLSEDDALCIDHNAFDDAAIDALFADFPTLPEGDDAAFEDALLAEHAVYDADPTGGAPSPW